MLYTIASTLRRAQESGGISDVTNIAHALSLIAAFSGGFRATSAKVAAERGDLQAMEAYFYEKQAFVDAENLTTDLIRVLQ